MKEKIRIANAGGFWGDDLHAFKRQLTEGEIDYITMDFLAEITMSILKKQQLKNPNLGYVTDFIDQIRDTAHIIKEKNVTVITNAGGINPLGCGLKLIEVLKELNISLKIAVIDGDNIIDRIEDLYPAKTDFKNLETGEDFSRIKDRLQTANAYLGVKPILTALEEGADIIVAGRVTDTSITVAPMIYEFGWKLDDWDKLAAGVVAGHIIECGAQATGGNFSDWEKVERWDHFGYPIVEMYPDGEFVITKHENTGGLISVDTIREQLVYEMGDPAEYISPDVIVDFRTVQLMQESKNRVRVSGVKGRPSTPYLKVSMAYTDGYKVDGSVIISGPHALEKARAFKHIFWKRIGIQFERTNTEYVGHNACHETLAPDVESNEILVRFSAYDNDPSKLDEFSKQIAPLILSGPPGVAVTGGRPRKRGVITYWPTLVPKDEVIARVLVYDNGKLIKETEVPSVSGLEEPYHKNVSANEQRSSEKGEVKIPLIQPAEVEVRFYDLCLARSGDKGDTANIGVLARSKEIYDFLVKNLTADFMKFMFKEICKGRVIRYELPNILALNFLLEHSLDGGGTRSLKLDAQGKTYAQAFLNQRIRVPKSLLKGLDVKFKEI
jgi:hypothetical protein